MQIGAIARWLRRDVRPWQGDLSWATASGRGHDVVMLHGLAASHECWDGARLRLGPNMRLHLVQMRGFAGSEPSPERARGNFLKPMADELADYVRAEAQGPVSLVGHSMGGLVSLILARDHPDVLARLMVVDVPSFFSVLINPFATAPMFVGLAEAARRRYLSRDAVDLEDDLRRTVARLVTDPVEVEKIVRWGVLSDQATTADIMAEVMTSDLRPDLPKIGVPTDIIYAWDRAAAIGQRGLDQTYASAYAGLPEHRLLRVDAARHYIMLDQPDAFYRAMRAWLQR
ncbi:MAG: alpha/beta hydrolase [Hyphomonadaceae bacterium]